MPHFVTPLYEPARVLAEIGMVDCLAGGRLVLGVGRLGLPALRIRAFRRRQGARDPLALTRKNALFAGHDEGAAAWGRIATLIETAKMNNVESYACLKATLEAIASGHPASKIDELLPWAYTPRKLSAGCPAGPCACPETIAVSHS